MKNKVLSIVYGAILLLVAAFSASCSKEKNTVWTDSATYAEFSSAFQTTLADGNYVRVEISNSQWKEIRKNLTKEGRHSWDEETIKKWLISNGFGEYEATKESSWLVLINHGFLASRSGNVVYMMLK